MKKHICAIIAICVALVMGGVNVSALTYDMFVYEIIDNEAVITTCTRNFESIPDTIDGYPVTKIGSKAFCAVYSYDNIEIPNSVKYIESYAFCAEIGPGFCDITIPKSVIQIGNYAIGYTFKYIGSYDYLSRIEPLENMIIRGYTGTAAETYAKNNGFTFIALDEPDVTTTTSTTTTATTETTVTTATTPDITTNIKGDANGDGRLAAGDAAFIAKKLAEASVSGEEITVEKYPDADFNDDGQVTAADAADIARYLAEQAILVNKKLQLII